MDKIRIGDLVQYKHRYKENTGVVIKIGDRGTHAQVYWNNSLTVWETKNELEVVK